ncbi:GIY-YIG nuclease family protein [candidate division KSB1 bacterium]|nr:MAG: GIY-YIG nuclease family protein [candidate division KSB1 bacterium]MBC6946759.1 GIY-YIG nuclease family protein [candidate division KSB1 bacterium]MCE7941851.1 GIY-YIG nuclease family protein [Chlorobi bacterium CHB1]MDL1876417.1 GIY-YIG nuclease family protein [Cytophagia bacterium CHB2]
MKTISKNYFVYLLRCSDGTLYTGTTNDLRRRVQQHNAGKGARYTAGRRPVALVYVEICASRSEALRREAALRKLSHRQKLSLSESTASELLLPAEQ